MGFVEGPCQYILCTPTVPLFCYIMYLLNQDFGTSVFFHYNIESFVYYTSTYFINNLCTLQNMLMVKIYKHIKGDICTNDTRCRLTQHYFMFYVTDKIMLYVKCVE